MWRLSMKTTLAASASVIATLAHATDAGAVSNEELLRIIRSQAEQIEKLNRRLDTVEGTRRQAPTGDSASPQSTQIQTLERKVDNLEQKTKVAEADAAAAKKQAEEAKKTAEAVILASNSSGSGADHTEHGRTVEFQSPRPVVHRPQCRPLGRRST